MSITAEQAQKLLYSADTACELVLLGQTIGERHLMAVLSVLGGSKGCEVYIPSPANFFDSLARQQRDQDIRQTWRSGKTIALAIKYNISPTRVLQIVKEDPNTRGETP